MLTPEELAARLARRVKMTSTADLMLWADNAASGMQRQLDDFRRKPDEAHLAEIVLACNTMHAVAEEIAVRMREDRLT